MAKFFVSKVIASIKNIERRLSAEASEKSQTFQVFKNHFEQNYGTVQEGILGFIEGADLARLKKLSAVSSKVGKGFDFENLVADTRHNNEQISKELGRFHDYFGDIALPPDSGKPAISRKGFTASEIEKKLEEAIEARTYEPRLLKLARIITRRDEGAESQELRIERAAAFLRLCEQKTSFVWFKPAIRFGRSLNSMSEKGQFDALAEIRKIYGDKMDLHALKYIGRLRDQYEDDDEINRTLRDRVLAIFNSVSRFEVLSPVMEQDKYLSLSESFQRAADAQASMEKLKPIIDQYEMLIRATRADISILNKIEGLNSGQSVKFEEDLYEASLDRGRSAFTESFNGLLEELEEIQRQKEEAARRRRQEEARRNSSSTTSFGGGGGGGFSGGGGSFGGGGASGGWISCDPDAELKLSRRSFDLI